jgi:hypothetical protein
MEYSRPSHVPWADHDCPGCKRMGNTTGPAIVSGKEVWIVWPSWVTSKPNGANVDGVKTAGSSLVFVRVKVKWIVWPS